MYNLFFIKKVLQQRKQLSINKLAQKYGLSTRTIQNWEQGKLPTGKRNKSNIILKVELLIEDIAKYPDAYQYERAERLNVSRGCIRHNLKKLGITYKKNSKTPESRRRETIIIQR